MAGMATPRKAAHQTPAKSPKATGAASTRTPKKSVPQSERKPAKPRAPKKSEPQSERKPAKPTARGPALSKAELALRVAELEAENAALRAQAASPRPAKDAAEDEEKQVVRARRFEPNRDVLQSIVKSPRRLATKAALDGLGLLEGVDVVTFVRARGKGKMTQAARSLFLAMFSFACCADEKVMLQEAGVLDMSWHPAFRDEALPADPAEVVRAAKAAVSGDWHCSAARRARVSHGVIMDRLEAACSMADRRVLLALADRVGDLEGRVGRVEKKAGVGVEAFVTLRTGGVRNLRRVSQEDAEREAKDLQA